MSPLKNILIIAYLAIQVALPLRGFLFDKYETRGDFTWNMYSKQYRCGIRYATLTERGPELFDHREFFRRERVVMRVFHRRVLPEFHKYLCEEALGDPQSPAYIQGSAKCQLNDKPHQELIRPQVNICEADNYGIQ